MKPQVNFQKLRSATFVIVALLFASLSLKGQSTEGVAIGDTIKVVDPSAILELFSGSKGFLLPRMSSTMKDSIDNPANGLMVYDTTVNRMYYYNNGWKEFGLWFSDANNSNNIYYDQGDVAIGMDSFYYTLTVGGDKGIGSTATGDTVPQSPYGVSNVFSSNFTYNPGYYTDLVVSSGVGGGEGTVATGISAYIEAEGSQVVGITAEAMYSGTGAGFASPPFVSGLSGYTTIYDSTAVVVAIGVGGAATNDQQGINIGMKSGAASESTLANIGSMTVVNVPDGSSFDTLIARYPNRFTISGFLNNGNSDSTDFNLYALGDAKSYFEGDVGIGTTSPQTNLDVAGGVNAGAYLLNGDTVALGAWSKSGNDIYYDQGKVAIGPFPIDSAEGQLNVFGDIYLYSADTIAGGFEFPLSLFELSKDTFSYFDGMDTSIQAGAGVWMGTLDTTYRYGSLDTTVSGVLSGTWDDGVFSGMIAGDDSSWAEIKIRDDGLIRLLSIADNAHNYVAATPYGLAVENDIIQKVRTEQVSNPPTDTELDNLFTSPNHAGPGWTTYIKDSDSDNFYQIVAVDTTWYIFSATKAE